MPTKDFFSGMDPERDAAQNGRSDEDASFAGMQKLDFDWLDAGPGSADEEEDLGASFDALFEEQPQQSSRPARGGEAPKAAPFVLGQEDAAAPKQAPAPRPAGANAAPPRPAASRRAAQPSFDLSALEKEIDNHPRTAQPEALEGYTPLSLEGFGFEEEPRPAAPQAAASRPAAAQTAAPAAPTPRATAPQAAPAPSAASTSRPAAPAATPFFADEAPVQTVASAAPTPRSTAPQPSAPQAAPAPSAASTSRLAAPAATPFFADEAPAQNSAPRPAAAQTAASAAPGTTPRPAAPAPSAAPTSPTRPAAAQKPAASASQPAARPLGPGQSAAPRPASRPADYSTISFSLGDVSVEAPTMAFMPIEQINSAASAQAAANRRTAEKQAPAAPAALNAETRAARAAKERDIGAAVFSALMEQDAPPAPAASAGTGGAARASAATMEWPAAPRAEGRASRAPKPINWRASDETGAAAQPQPPVRPQPPEEALQTPPQPAPDDFTPLDFDFDGLDAADAPQEAPTRAGARGADFLDRYTDTGEERPPRRSSRNGGSGGARPPRKPSGEAKRGVPSKTVLAWCGILLIAVLVILFFVIFGEKDEAPSSAAPSSTPASSSVPPQSASVPAEPTVTPIPRDEWYMVLANRDSVLPSDFTVAQTQTVGEALVDARIAEALQQMVTDAAAAGIQLRPTNGYRTIARQQELWDARVQKLMTENGLSQADAEVRALDYTSRAGTSDHNTGLGLDIVSEDHPAKDTAYAETAAAQWLAAHAPDYGFILRYPSDKTEVTGMDFEPWHYRYVGVEQAKLIQASGLCLEEYLAQ